MERRYTDLGRMLRELRVKRDLKQKQVVAALEKTGHSFDERTLRHYEKGEGRPQRDALIFVVVTLFKETSIEAIDRIMNLGDYASLSEEEINRYKLSRGHREGAETHMIQTPEPQPQKVRWGPLDHKPAGIWIDGSKTPVLWKDLKIEIETKLLNQLGRCLPAGCSVELLEFNGREDLRVRIINPENKNLRVWLGPDPERQWEWDGLVRVGDAPSDYTAIVWQVFQRYSDGSYRLIKAIY